jgi:uncharacterized protein YaaN involved in tellurite resistance
MTSPLSKLKAVSPAVSAEIQERDQLFDNAIRQQYSTPVNGSPLANVPKQANIMPATLVQDTDIDKLGADLSRNVGQTTEKIMQKMGLVKFDELGQILASVTSEVNKLDPASLKKGGVLGWFQNKFTDIKQELTVRLKNADAVFDTLSEKISNHITVQNEWVRDLEALYNENYQRYNTINEVIKQGESWRTAMQAQIDSWPVVSPDDPDAGMKIQAKRDAEARLNRIQIKLDSFMRLKTLAESNAPKIKSQQETSRNTIMTLKDIIDQTIPMVKMEFTLYIQSLDAQKSIQIVNNAKSLANTTLIKSADTAKQAAVDAATALNSPVIATDTLNHIRNRMLETVKEVKQIEQTSRDKRDADATAIAAQQKQYLNALQNNNAV